MKGVILHGGYGTRLRPLTHTGPKQLIPVANKPISQHALEDLIAAGINDIAFVLGDVFPEKVKEYYGDGNAFGARITYIQQGMPKGIAHAISLCKEYTGSDSFVVYLGDNLLKGGINHLVKRFETSNFDAMVLLCQVEEPQKFGVAKLDEKGKLLQLIEKPKHPPSNYALTGIYFFKPIIYDMIDHLKPSWRSELEITDAIQLLLEKSCNVGHQIVQGWWKDTGTPEDILEANRLVLDELKAENRGKIENQASIQGRVSIGQNTTVKHGAMVRGPAIVGSNSIIQNDVYIGPYTSIGNNTTINRGELENSIIMNNCQIDVEDRIVDSLVGPNSCITSGGRSKPKARRFLIGEQSQIIL